MLVNFEYEELFFENDGIRLHAVAAGPKRGPVVVLLHGFPEFWYGWHNQIGPLAAAGFRVPPRYGQGIIPAETK
jgi:epoxide hydrolase 4